MSYVEGTHARCLKRLGKSGVFQSNIPAGDVRGILATVIPILKLLIVKLIYLLLERLIYNYLFSARRDRRGEGRFLPWVTGYD